MLALSANALDLSQYISAKLKSVDFNGRISATGPDFGMKSGMDINGDTFGGSIAAGIASEIGSGNVVRFELEYNKTSDNESSFYWDDYKAENSAEAYMLNAYYDFRIDSKFTPYVGVGIGSAKVKYKMKEWTYSESFSDRKLAWQIGAGIAYAATDNVSVDVGYRYIDYGDFKKHFEDWSGSYSFSTRANELYVGLRYSF